MLKIAVKAPNWLGDIIMSLPFLLQLKTSYPQARIDLIVSSNYHSFSFLDRFNLVEYEDNPLKLGLKLRKEKYDQFWLLTLSFSSALLAFISGAKERIGYKSELRSFLLTKAYSYHAPASSTHDAREQFNLIEH